jgi:gamma-glutamyltranspeptidase / glutathione hydrolase
MSHVLDRRTFLKVAGAVLGLSGPLLAADPPAKAAKGLVLGQPQAAEAGLAVLAAGGNAVDAAVAGALVAGVVAVAGCGIGGYGGHLVIARPDGDKVTAIDFNTAAPAAARDDLFPLDDKGAVKDGINSHGWLAAGVPGTLAGLQLALDKYGSQKFAHLAEPAIRHAREGFPVTKALAAGIKAAKDRLGRDPGSAKLFFEKGEPLAEGAKYRNPDLADLLQTLADAGSVEPFYRGDVAKRIAAAFRDNKGLVTVDDLAAYKAREVKPLKLEWRDQVIYTAPLTAGGLTVLQALATLKALDWPTWDPKEPSTVQGRVEALRIAWDDRLRLLGDPEQAKVPVEQLLSERYAEKCADRVRVAVMEKKPVAGESDGRPADGTIHLTAVDGEGMMVALTLTHGESFGAQVTVDGLGLILGHGMSRFDPRPGKPNSVGAGKRPLHNMCPTVVCRDGKPVLALGATGGRKIPNTLFDVLAYRIGEGRSLAEAVQGPRVHTEGDMQLTLEAKWPEATVDYLKGMGYAVKTGTGATLNAIERDAKTGELTSAAR